MMRPTNDVKNKPKPTWMRRIGTVLIFIVWLIVVIEVSTRILFSFNRPPHWILGTDDTSWRLAWVRLHQTGRSLTGQYSVYHAERGWAVRPDIKDMSVFGGKILNSNSKGLRGKTSYEYQRTPGKGRIVVLGDSFTFGEEVSDEETYPHDLESALSNTEVLNLGVSGYGHDQMLLDLKEEGVKYHPDVVLLGFVFPDVYRNILSFYSYAKPRFKLAPDGLSLTNVPVPTPDRVLAEESYRLKSLDLLLILKEKLRGRFGLIETEARDMTRSLLDEIVATTRGVGGIPVLVYLPVGDEISDSQEAKTGGEQYLDSYCQDRGVACLFLRPKLLDDIKNGARFRYQPDGHWGPEEHMAAAEAIKNFLREKSLVQSGLTSSSVPSKRDVRN